jgi:hypothetical protein
LAIEVTVISITGNPVGISFGVGSGRWGRLYIVARRKLRAIRIAGSFPIVEE